MSTPISHFEQIRGAASRASSGTLEDTQAYVALILSFANPDTPLARALEHKITALQLLYHRQAIGPVWQHRLITALNKLADEAGLPDYGRTSHLEFTLIRLTASAHMPELSGEKLPLPEPPAQLPDILESVDASGMSPAEALYLVWLLLRQKLVNPQFQINEAELTARCASLRARPAKSSSAQYTLHALPVSARDTIIRTKLQTYCRRLLSEKSANEAVNSFLAQLGYTA